MCYEHLMGNSDPHQILWSPCHHWSVLIRIPSPWPPILILISTHQNPWSSSSNLHIDQCTHQNPWSPLSHPQTDQYSSESLVPNPPILTLISTLIRTPGAQPSHPHTDQYSSESLVPNPPILTLISTHQNPWSPLSHWSVTHQNPWSSSSHCSVHSSESLVLIFTLLSILIKIPGLIIPSSSSLINALIRIPGSYLPILTNQCTHQNTWCPLSHWLVYTSEALVSTLTLTSILIRIHDPHPHTAQCTHQNPWSSSSYCSEHSSEYRVLIFTLLCVLIKIPGLITPSPSSLISAHQNPWSSSSHPHTDQYIHQNPWCPPSYWLIVIRIPGPHPSHWSVQSSESLVPPPHPHTNQYTHQNP